MVMVLEKLHQYWVFLIKILPDSLEVFSIPLLKPYRPHRV
jgi:hypothetical protein